MFAWHALHRIRNPGRVVAGVLAATFVVAAAAYAQPHPGPAWMTHVDRAGFTVIKPADWRVFAGTPGEFVISDPRGASAAMVRARIVPAAANLAQWLQQRYVASEPSLQNVRVLRVETKGPQVAHAAFDYGSSAFVGRASVIAVRHGDIATIFIAAAARAEFPQRLPELARILESFRFGAASHGGGAATSRAGEALVFARWVDPVEHSFSVDLPAGWRTEGGLRRTTWNVRLAFGTTSPDGAVHVFSGDATIPRMFVQPNATTRSLGTSEGQLNGPDNLAYLSFQRAEDFGAGLVRRRFGAQPTGARPRPDLVEIARRNPLLQGGASAASAADIDFRMPDGRVGVLTLTTFGAMVGNVGASWWAEGVHGFVAPADRVGLAAQVMERMIVSTRENPGWAAGEREHQIRMGQQYQAYLAWSRDLQQKSIAERWRADEMRQRDVRDMLGGTVRLLDPTTGETFETAAQDRYFFRIKGTNVPSAVGTETDFRPIADVDLTRLLRIGVEAGNR